MVFATDFDPYNELDQASNANAERHSSESFRSVREAGVGSAVKVFGKGTLTDAVPAVAENDVAENAAAENKVIPLHLGAPATRVRIENKSLLLPRQPKLPLGLQLLNRLQQGSAMVMGVLVTGALVVYGSTVYVDKSTSRALVKLDELQGESQQLTSANESIKQSLAEQAVREDSELEPYEADDVLLLPPAPLRESVAPAEPAPELPGPLGY